MAAGKPERTKEMRHHNQIGLGSNPGSKAENRSANDEGSQQVRG